MPNKAVPPPSRPSRQSGLEEKGWRPPASSPSATRPKPPSTPASGSTTGKK